MTSRRRDADGADVARLAAQCHVQFQLRRTADTVRQADDDLR